VYNRSSIRVLITGITGFVGSHLAEYALGKGAEVYGSIRWRSKTENIEHLRAQIRLIESDLRDLSSVQGLLEASNPDYVVHLAAQSFVAASWQTPAETLYTNTVSQVNLLEAIRRRSKKPRFLVVGSSEEYGLVSESELPIKETNPLRTFPPIRGRHCGGDSAPSGRRTASERSERAESRVHVSLLLGADSAGGACAS